jgi:CubicO group peptidase (beta-lactamase class C family)
MVRKAMFGLLALAACALLLATGGLPAPARPAAKGPAGAWQITATDGDGTKWAGAMALTAGKQKGALVGYIDWSATGGSHDGASGRERVRATYDPGTRVLKVRGIRLERMRGIALGAYEANLSEDGSRLENGTWADDEEVRWSARRAPKAARPAEPPAEEAAPPGPGADERSRRVDGIVNKYIHPNGPGMAVLVVQDGKVVHQKGYGLADLEKKTPITPRTTFELASVSKQFTATAVMLLHDRGRLRFDDDVRKYLPALPAYDPERPIRVRDLLNHTSGLADYLSFKRTPARDPDFPTNEEVFRQLVKRKRLRFPTGSKYEYSNTGYVVLALLVERLGGKSFGTFLKEEVFEPLGMKDTVAFEGRRVVRRHRALGYEHVEAAPAFEEDDSPAAVRAKTRPGLFRVADSETVVVGDGSVWSNLEDLARWDAAVRGRKLLRQETWQRAFTNLRLDNGEESDEDYGFGWGLHFGPRGKLLEVYHAGAWIGYATGIRRHLTRDLATVILCNIDDFDLDPIEDAIHDLYLGKKKAGAK